MPLVVVGDAKVQARLKAIDTAYPPLAAALSARAEAEEKAWKAALEPVAQKWAEGVPNGAAVLKAFREEVAALRK